MVWGWVASDETLGVEVRRASGWKVQVKRDERLRLQTCKRTRRQEPASCESCRKKKLRCDRQFPCHNCESRSIQCVFQGSRPQVNSGPRYETGASDLAAESAAIKDRLQRLEKVVFRHGLATPSIGAHRDGGAPSTTGSVTLRSPATIPNHSPEAEQAEHYNDDSRHLENIHTLGVMSLPPLTRPPPLDIVPIATLVGLLSSRVQPAKILLPQREVAKHLFACYVDHLDALQHIIHVPTVRDRIQLFYDSLGVAENSHSNGTLALFLAILGHIAGFWALGTFEGSVFASRQEALAVCNYWLRCALDVTESVWRFEGPSLEIIQAKILLMFLMYHLSGLSSQARHMVATAIADAKDLGLHMTDSPQRSFRETLLADNQLSLPQCPQRPSEMTTQQDIIEVEMRRRVWWHLVATEWSAALFGGPHEGVYSIHPNHMICNKPRNVTDEDLMTMPASYSRPEDEPTTTTYYLQRIKLAEVCREVADTLLEIHALQDPQKISYSRIIALDGRFAEILNGPLASGAMAAEDSSHNHHEVGPHLKQQYFTYLTTEARRSKLHLPYLLRLGQDPQYMYSRNTCLQSARNILRLKHILPSEMSTDCTGSFKMMGLVHHFCCAIVILAMDLCVNTAAGCENERKAEIRAACRILEDARENSASAGLFLDSLTAIFRKHKVRLQSDQPAKDAVAAGYPVEHHAHRTCAGLQDSHRGRFGVGLFPADYMTAEQSDPVNAEPDFDTFWQDYLDLGTEPQAWDALFNDIEMGAP